MSTISSRTPEGWDNYCPACRQACKIEPSTDSHDAPCPNCGQLLWFARWGTAYVSATDLADIGDPEVTVGTLPDDLIIAPQILDLCPQQLALENCVIPVDLIHHTLVIAMHDPTNIEKVNRLRFVLNLDVRILHIDRQVLQRHVSACYGTTT